MTPARARGFTLLELLVVMFIIGIIAAMATLSVGSATRATGTEKEIERLGDLLALASEEAVLQGREFGLTFYAREYEFSAWDAGAASWEPLGADAGPFAPRPFPPEALVDLEIDDRLVSLAPAIPVRKEKKRDSQAKAGTGDGTARRNEERPQVLILSSGDITPFELRLRPGIGKRGISLSVAADGNVERKADER